MLVSSKQMLQKAHKGHYAVGAFNVNDMEMVEAVIDAAKAEHAPVIIQTSEGAIDYARIEYLYAMIKEAAKVNVPVAFHLDHGKDFKLAKEMIKRGFQTSVMFDGSSLPFAENVKKTREIVRLAKKKKIQVEAELGAIAGIEDFVSVAERDAHFTSPEQAATFVKKTGCDSLAVAIGTSHGAYKFSGSSRLDIERLKQIKEAVNIPLVLHGASSVPLWLKRRCLAAGAKIEDAKGVAEEQIVKAIEAGINKVNVDTDLRLAFTAAVRQALNDDPSNIDPRKYLGPARELMTKVVREKMRLFGCAGKA